MSKNEYELLKKLGLFDPVKQGVLILIVSGLLFASMLVLNADYKWTYSAPPNCHALYYRCDGVIGLGFNMAEWAIFSFIGVAIGLVRIFVINSKK